MMSTLARATSVCEIFGPRHYGAISGAMALGANGARAIGPVGASLVLLALGSYERLFWLLSAALAIVSGAVLAAGAEVTREEPANSADAAESVTHPPARPDRRLLGDPPRSLVTIIDEFADESENALGQRSDHGSGCTPCASRRVQSTRLTRRLRTWARVASSVKVPSASNPVRGVADHHLWLVDREHVQKHE